MSVADNLRAARDLIDGGWCQRSYKAIARTYGNLPQTLYCSSGALLKVCRGTVGYNDAYNALVQSIGVPDLIRWNDMSERTKGEVIAAFNKAIEDAEHDADTD